MNALWITLALLISGFGGWPVTALVFRLARTIDDRSDSRADAAAGSLHTADDPAGAVDGDITLPAGEPAEAGAVLPAEHGAATPVPTDGAAPAPAVP